MASKRASKKKTAKPAKLGRPTLYTAKLAERICALLVEGFSLRAIGELEGMPDRTTIVRWLVEKEDFRIQYVRAREMQAFVDEDNLIEIADDDSQDFVEKTINGRKQKVFNKQHVERSKLRVDTRKWLMARRQPKRYGDKLDLNHSGEVNITETMQEARDRLREKRERLQVEAKARLQALQGKPPQQWIQKP